MAETHAPPAAAPDYLPPGVPAFQPTGFARILGPAGLLLPAALLLFGQFQFHGYVKDDTFISMRYARNLAQGLGLVFNPGDAPLEGYSNFLWVLLEVPAHLLPGAPLMAVKGLSMAAAMGAMLYTVGLARLWSGGARLLPLLAGVLFATSPTTALWGQSGLEGPLMAFFSAGCFFHLARATAQQRDADLLLAALFATGGALTRPEGHLLLIAGVGAVFLGTLSYGGLGFAAARAWKVQEQGPEGRTLLKLAAWFVGGLVAVAVLTGILSLFALPADDLAEARGHIWAQWRSGLPTLLLTLGVVVGGGAVAARLLLPRLAVLATSRVWLRWPPLRFTLMASALMAPYHLTRILYFGDIFPNTYYVKAAGGPEVMREGMVYVRGLLEFHHLAVFLVLGLLGVVFRRFLVSRLVAAALVAVLLAYLVKIGRDEMKYYRLFLPALPLVLALATEGARRLARGVPGTLALPSRVVGGLLLAGALAAFSWGSETVAVAEALGDRAKLLPLVGVLGALPVLGLGMFAARFDRRRGTEPRALRLAGTWVVAVLVVIVSITAWDGLAYAVRKGPWHSNYIRWSQRSFARLGEYIDRRAEPGEAVIFQDMGAAPYAGGDLRWVDTIGILDPFVAHALYDIRLNPFLRGAKNRTPGGAQQIREFDARVRAYLLEQEAPWVAAIAYVSRSSRRQFRRDFREAEDRSNEALHDLLMPRVRGNRHYHGLFDERAFTDHYELEAAWRRNDGYYVVLFRRIRE